MLTDPWFGGLARALVGRYTLVRELGRGGMATVYLGTDVKLGRGVAIKLLAPATRAYLGSDRFQREVLLAAQLSHPHIVPLFEADEADGLLFYVMEYVEGESLHDRLERDGPLAVEEAIRITAEVGDALEYAHESGVIHRDIKPGNILLSRGHAMVSDFGIAKVLFESGTATGGSAITGTGITVGTAEYMSPEQASGEKRIDARSDVYALAAVPHEMLTGDPPSTGPSARALGRRPPGGASRRRARRYTAGARWRLPSGWYRAGRDGRTARLLLYRLDGGDCRRVRAFPRRHPLARTVGANAAGDVARDRGALGGGASVLSLARSRGSPADGSRVGGGGGGPERDGLPVGKQLGAPARQRGRGDGHAQAGRIISARALGQWCRGPDRQRLGV